MGCTNCQSKGGCSARKGEERALLSELLAHLYPAGRWGEPDDEARFRAGVPAAEGRRLARAAAAVLEAPTFFQPGAEDEACDYIYVLCVGRRPGLLEVARGQARAEEQLESGRDVYLRVALSSMARVAAVQEVVFELERDGDHVLVRERPRDGVYDPILLRRTQKLIDLLVGADITYLDFGLLTKSATRYLEGLDDGEYEARFGQPPGTVNWLFYPQPSTAVATSFLPAHAA